MKRPRPRAECNKCMHPECPCYNHFTRSRLARYKDAACARHERTSPHGRDFSYPRLLRLEGVVQMTGAWQRRHGLRRLRSVYWASPTFIDHRSSMLWPFVQRLCCCSIVLDVWTWGSAHCRSFNQVAKMVLFVDLAGPRTLRFCYLCMQECFGHTSAQSRA